MTLVNLPLPCCNVVWGNGGADAGLQSGLFCTQFTCF